MAYAHQGKFSSRLQMAADTEAIKTKVFNLTKYQFNDGFAIFIDLSALA